MYYVAIAYLLYQEQTDLPLDFQGLAGQRRRGNIASMIDRYSNRLKGRKGDSTRFRYLGDRWKGLPIDFDAFLVKGNITCTIDIDRWQCPLKSDPWQHYTPPLKFVFRLIPQKDAKMPQASTESGD